MPIISRRAEATSSHEYGCDLRRLYPWDSVAAPLWGAAMASIQPQEATAQHSHDEEETFILFRGRGTITVDGEAAAVEAGDVIYLPRNSVHSLRNDSEVDGLEFLTIFWGSPEADHRMLELAAAMTARGRGGDA